MNLYDYLMWLAVARGVKQTIQIVPAGTEVAIPDIKTKLFGRYGTIKSSFTPEDAPRD